MADSIEKTATESHLPGYSSDDSPRRISTSGDYKHGVTEEYEKLGFWTRMGCTPESFQRRPMSDKHNQLNQTLRSRHMHMIAIGKESQLSLGKTC